MPFILQILQPWWRFEISCYFSVLPSPASKNAKNNVNRATKIEGFTVYCHWLNQVMHPAKIANKKAFCLAP